MEDYSCDCQKPCCTSARWDSRKSSYVAGLYAFCEKIAFNSGRIDGEFLKELFCDGERILIKNDTHHANSWELPE